MADGSEDDISPDELRAEVRAYREARLARLTAGTGWLALINKTWLREGVQTVGSAPDSDILLPADRAPARLGTFTRAGTQVEFAPAASVAATARGAAVTSPLVVRSDAEPQPDSIAVGSLRFELIQRAGDLAIRVRDVESTAARSFPGIPCFDIDPAARIVARFEPGTPPRTFDIPDSDGRVQTFVSPGVAVFTIDGVACRLNLFPEGQSRLFVLFGDATNRTETYGAGRFLYAPLPANGRVVLDFNKAFNPPCAFTPLAACPLPPAENRLPVRIAAGEKRPAAHAG